MPWLAVIIAGGAFAVSLAATGLVRFLLRQRGIYDRPNERSSHEAPTPRGGGLAVMIAVAAGWIAAGTFATAGLGAPVVVLALGLALAAVSFLDDLKGLPVAARLTVQILAVAAGLAALPPELFVFQGLLPFALDRVIAGLLWLWFVNLYNFMDGIDGITGIESACLGAGIAMTVALAPLEPELALYGAAIVGAAAGFLVWNWQPAKIFLGDVGSIGLGYLLGWLLLLVAANGAWAAALILPAYYLSDATITLFRRLFRGERIWMAHREHFYQQGARALGSHAAVAGRVLAGNLVLLAAAALALVPNRTMAGIAMAGMVCLILLWYFATVTPRSKDGA